MFGPTKNNPNKEKTVASQKEKELEEISNEVKEILKPAKQCVENVPDTFTGRALIALGAAGLIIAMSFHYMVKAKYDS